MGHGIKDESKNTKIHYVTTGKHTFSIILDLFLLFRYWYYIF